VKEKNKYVFRRVRGRVVPIRVSEKKKAGFGAIAGGLALAVGTAEAAKLAVTKSAEIRIRARRDFRLASALTKAIKKTPEQLTLGLEKQVAKDFASKLAAKRFGSRMLFKSRNAILAAGTIGATALIQAGLSKIQKDNSNIKQEVAENAAIGAAVGMGVSTLYYNRLGVGQFGRALKFAIMRSKKIPRPVKIPIKTVQETLKF
jgi:hypothetical protein